MFDLTFIDICWQKNEKVCEFGYFKIQFESLKIFFIQIVSEKYLYESEF